jgi:colanic acid biosynthesis glycosyl transferase WcaI
MTQQLLMLTQWFDPEPTPKGLSFGKELVRNGFKVDVVTGFPNYPGGKLYPGYKLRVLQKEFVDGVTIIRVPLYPSHDASAIKRILNYITFSAAAFLYCVLSLKRPNVVYAYQPPLTVAIIGIALGIFRKVPVVLDIQDLWPDTLKSTGMLLNVKLLNITKFICLWTYRKADYIVVLSPGFKRLLEERGVPKDKIRVIFNWCDETSLQNSTFNPPNGIQGSKYFRILFAGTMGKAQALDAVIDAAEILFKKSIPICFIFIGGGIDVERLKAYANGKKLSNIVFLSRVSMSEIGSFLRQADALLVHLRKDPLFKVTIPSKIQAYMAIGKPILVAVEGDAADLVNAARCGITANSENPESIASAAIRLFHMSSEKLHSMGSQGQTFYFSKLSLKSGVGYFIDIFREVITRSHIKYRSAK